MVSDDAPDQKTGFLTGHSGQYILIDDDDLPWLLDGEVRLARYRDGFVTISGFAYGECRFTVIAIADAE